MRSLVPPLLQLQLAMPTMWATKLFLIPLQHYAHVRFLLVIIVFGDVLFLYFECIIVFHVGIKEIMMMTASIIRNQRESSCWGEDVWGVENKLCEEHKYQLRKRQTQANNDKPVTGYFLGDSGYMLRDWLLIPLTNYHQSSARTTVERSIGVAKEAALPAPTTCLPSQGMPNHHCLHNTANSDNYRPVALASIENSRQNPT